MRSLRPLIRITTVLAAFASLAGCKGCSESETIVAPSSAMNAAQVDLARRIAETQLNNGSWGFTGTWYQPIDYTFAGFQNTTGVSALGLFDAYQADLTDDGVVQEMWFVPSTLERAKDFLIQWMDDFVNGTVNPAAEDPSALSGTIPTTVSIQNFLFCKRYEDLFGLTAGEVSTVAAAFDLLLANRDASHGTDPTVIADGHFNRTVQFRTGQGIPGIVGWDVGFLVRALIAMEWPQAEIDWVVNAMKALPTLDASLTNGLMSIAHVLNVLNLIGDTSMNATLRPAMQAERNPDGSYGVNPEAENQATSFCLMALKTLGITADVPDTQAWLESQIHVGGFVYDPATHTEVYEYEGELLWSLVYLYP